MCLSLFLLVASLCAHADAVVYQYGHFIANTTVIIQVPIASVRTILMDYENLPAVNPSIKKVIIISKTASETMMKVQAQACILWFCRAYQWQQSAKILANGDIITKINPNNDTNSDFKQGMIKYRFTAIDNKSTRLQFAAELEPNFWLPPIVGPWLIKRKLINEARQTARLIEQFATAKP